ncbi:beta-amyrin 28-monooxygenase isoform X4 [Populus trichocarpa]|uniref:beta-amyrin 28-monooxygenase isoform X4 n=1 Tax=Populus trichocarpa TaxID=3694 RepID=UPI0022792F50|nr:beta-amyrin 28-monooxygenase isoform X4 [Populus trichocarpa]
MQIAMFSTLILLGIVLLVSLYIITKTLKERLIPNPHLPPGSLGWPLIGETLNYLGTCLAGRPDWFLRDRMEKHDPQVFKTSLFGETVAVFCGPAGNKFLFSNENKLVNLWWPRSVKKLLKSSLVNVAGDEAKRIRRILLTFLDPDALKRYIERMDLVTQHHISTLWEGKEELKLHPTINLYTFELSCRLFASIDDPTHISKLAHHFDIFLKGVIHFPIYVPGTPFYRASKAADAIKEELRLIARRRREALDKKMESHRKDLLSHLLVTTDASGKLLSESEIVDNMLMLLFASHDTTTSAMTCVMKYLAELPEVYEMVLREQLDIAKSKEAGELLKWEDIQRMRYSCNVVSEVLRMIPPIRGTFRKALVDFTYAGYKIPKGWKLYWSPDSTTKDPAYFPNPEEFDPSRYEGAGPAPYTFVPFGGGGRVCIGNEYSRPQILVFMHNIVKRFKWDLLIPDEKVTYDPMPAPSHGLPIRIQQHQSTA